MASSSTKDTSPSGNATDTMDVICRPTWQKHPSGILLGITTLEFSFFIILLELSLILTTMNAVRFILRPLRQPKVISDIIAGIIIGPSVLCHNKKFQKFAFPDDAQFVIRNIGIIGFMFFLFMSGVKMDLTVIKNAGRKQWIIAAAGLVVPCTLSFGTGFGLRKHMNKEMAKFSSFGGISAGLVITNFPVVYAALEDMHLLSSEIGRLALSTVIISDIVGLNIIVAFEAWKQAELRSMNALYYVLSVMFVSNIVFGVIPRVMEWIKRKTPEGKAVDQSYITMILFGVFAMGFVTDFIGAAIANGPIWLGLAIPDGPPIGSTLVERTETVMSQLLTPFSFACMGLLTDVFQLSTCWSCLMPMFVMAIVSYVSKLICVVAATQYCKIPLKEGLTLALMLSLRGQVEFLIFMHWVDWKMIGRPELTMMVILTTILTGICSPLISFLYDPTRPYMTNKRRTIQHNQPNSELRIVGTIVDQESISSLCSLLDISNPSVASPFSIFALNLIEKKGRASPVYLDHSEQPDEYYDSNDEAIHHALTLYEQSRNELISMHLYTAVTAQKTQYQDICEHALLHKVSLIILPFHLKCIDPISGAGVHRQGIQSVNYNCLLHAPCSVAILVAKSSLEVAAAAAATSSSVAPTIPFSVDTSTSPFDMIMSPSHYCPYRRIAMLFLGGADCREALTLADRMVGDPQSTLMVVRFLSQNYEGDDEMERKLDDGVVTAFWVKNESNERVIYREVVVKHGEDTITAIQAMNEGDPYDLWIVGRKNGINSTLLQGLSDWSENPELGMVGDYLASSDFSTRASVLVMQQQILRDDRHRSLIVSKSFFFS